MEQPLDKNTLDGLISGDRQIIKGIYNSHFKTVESWIKNNGGNREDAFDVFQDSLEAIIIKVLNSPLRIHSSFSAFFIRVCKNKWVDHLRKKKLEERVRLVESKRHSDGEVEESFDEIQKTQLLRKVLDTNFKRISETCQQLLSLLQEGLSPDEVAKHMEMSNANTVYRRKFACLKKWKELIESDNQYSLYNSY